VAERRCHYCGKWFVPDSRVGDRQRACSVSCQRLRKREINRLYRQKNPGYWKNHYEDYVKPWRQQHPDYQRQWRQRKKAEKRTSPAEKQAERIGKAIELTERIQLYLRGIQSEIQIKTKFFKRLGASYGFRYKLRLLFWRLSSRIIHRMTERIHKRLPVKFVREVLESFNEHRVSEKEAMDLLATARSCQKLLRSARFHLAPLRKGGHSSPGSKTWGFLASFINDDILLSMKAARSLFKNHRTRIYYSSERGASPDKQ
jgi:hypothetical protein